MKKIKSNVPVKKIKTRVDFKVLAIAITIIAITLGYFIIRYSFASTVSNTTNITNNTYITNSSIGYTSLNKVSDPINETQVWGCKKSVNSIFGPLWSTRILVQRPNTIVKSFIVKTIRNGTIVSTANSGSWDSSGYAYATINASQLYRDKIALDINLNGTYGSFAISPNDPYYYLDCK